METTIEGSKEQYGHNSPEAAEKINCIADDKTSKGDNRSALKYHQEALKILEWNKCNALLYDLTKKSKEYAVDMAITLRKIGSILRENNNFVVAAGEYTYHVSMRIHSLYHAMIIYSSYIMCQYIIIILCHEYFFTSSSLMYHYHLPTFSDHLEPFAEIYKESLDMFLEGLVENGGVLKRKLLESEYKHKKGSSDNNKVLEGVDRKKIGRVLSLHPTFRLLVKDISQLFGEIQVVKFVGNSAASSKRRRRMQQNKARDENLKHAIESLSMLSSPTASPTSTLEKAKPKSSPKKRDIDSISSSSSISSDDDEYDETSWMRGFYEKEAGRFNRPRPPLSRSMSLTEDEQNNHYRSLSQIILPVEEILHVAINRFPLPDCVGDVKSLQRDNSACGSFDSVKCLPLDKESDQSPKSVRGIFSVEEDNPLLKNYHSRNRVFTT